MYYPFLYGLSMELLALRDLAPVASELEFSPVVEPAAADPSALIRAVEALEDTGIIINVVINPQFRDFESAGAQAQWLDDARDALEANHVRPVFCVSDATSRLAVQAFARNYAGRPLGLAIRSGVLRAQDLLTDLSGADCRVFVHHNVDDAPYVASFGAPRVVRLTDSFSAQARNADFGDDDWFSNIDSLSDSGFGDYTVLPAHIAKPGGGAPGAVVIHATYVSADRALWVRHFLSDTVDRAEGNASTKLAECMSKLASDRTMFLDSPGMLSFDKQTVDDKPTSLGNNKRQQISHHIYTTCKARAGHEARSNAG